MSMSPLMPKLSAVSELTSPFCCWRSVLSRRRRRPTVIVGMISQGRITSAITVKRQSSATMVNSVVVRMNTFEKIETRVPETTWSTPAMSLVKRDMSSPVRASVKKRRDSACKRENISSLRSYMMRWLTTVFR